jgi:hypothetical protein
MIHYKKDTQQVRINTPKPFAKSVNDCVKIEGFLRDKGYGPVKVYFDRDTVVIQLCDVEDLTRFSIEYGNRPRNFTDDLAVL